MRAFDEPREIDRSAGRGRLLLIRFDWAVVLIKILGILYTMFIFGRWVFQTELIEKILRFRDFEISESHSSCLFISSLHLFRKPEEVLSRYYFYK